MMKATIVLLFVFATLAAVGRSIYLTRREPASRREWHNTLLATLISVAMAVAVALVVYIVTTQHQHAKAKKTAEALLEVELSDIIGALQVHGTNDVLRISSGPEAPSYPFRSVYVKSVAVDAAMNSGLFEDDVATMRALLSLARSIDYYNHLIHQVIRLSHTPSLVSICIKRG